MIHTSLLPSLRRPVNSFSRCGRWANVATAPNSPCPFTFLVEEGVDFWFVWTTIITLALLNQQGAFSYGVFFLKHHTTREQAGLKVKGSIKGSMVNHSRADVVTSALPKKFRWHRPEMDATEQPSVKPLEDLREGPALSIGRRIVGTSFARLG